MRIVVTGAAGYVGGAVVAELWARGHDLLLIDISNKPPHLVADAITYHQGLIASSHTAAAIDRLRPDGCVHLAGSVDTEASRHDPLGCWRNNVSDTVALLEALQRSGCRRVVFSSTAAAYAPLGGPTHRLREDDPLAPANPLGATKLACGNLLRNRSTSQRFHVGIARFINAAGALPEYGKAHAPESHLIPRAITAALTRTPVHLYGTPTMRHPMGPPCATTSTSKTSPPPAPHSSTKSNKPSASPSTSAPASQPLIGRSSRPWSDSRSAPSTSAWNRPDPASPPNSSRRHIRPGGLSWHARQHALQTWPPDERAVRVCASATAVAPFGHDHTE
jgi:NAD-dependent epimerase/dehydratase family protein